MVRRLSLFVLLALSLAAQDESRNLPRFEAEEFKARRKALAREIGSGWVVSLSRVPKKGWCVEWPTEMAIDSGLTFRYLVGRDLRGGRLVLDAESGAAVLFAEGDAEKLRAETGIEDVRGPEAFAGYLSEMKKKSLRAYIDTIGMTASVLKSRGFRVSRRPLARALLKLRSVKSEAELRMMRTAARATCRALVEAMTASEAGINEAELQRIIEARMQREGCDRLAFRSICGGSANTPVIHYRDNNKEVKDGELILCDVGGSYRGYASDVTRTWPVNGRFTEKQRRAYQAVLAAQKAAEKLLKAGVTWKELERAARNAIQEAGWGKGSYARVHTLGHYVGLQTHDLGDARVPLKAGMVITIEPGIYDRESMISIRIEDDYLVTEDGFERLTRYAPREIEEIEKLVGSALEGKQREY